MASAQSNQFSKGFWEKQDEIQRIEYHSHEKPAMVEHQIMLFDFFPTRSGVSGEVLQYYERRSFSYSMNSERDNEIVLQLPQYGHVTHFDYRLWKDGLIILEAKEVNVREILNSANKHDSIGDYKKISFKLGDITPRSVLEIYYRMEGVSMPNSLCQSRYGLYVDSSLVAIRVGNNVPLNVWANPKKVKIEQEEELGRTTYTFTTTGLESRGEQHGIANLDVNDAVIYADYKKPIVGAKPADSWADLVRLLAKSHEIRDYKLEVFALAMLLGKQIQMGPMRTNVDFYRNHLTESLMANRYFEEMLPLSATKSEYLPFYSLDREMKDLLVAFDNQPIDLSMALLHKKVSLATESYIVHNRGKPFRSHPILYSFYARLLEHRGLSHSPVFLKSRARGQFNPEFVSFKQFDAMGVLYKNEKGEEHFIFPGVYAGQLLDVDEIPSTLKGSTAVVYDLESDTLRLLETFRFQSASNKVETVGAISLNAKYGKLYFKDTLHFYGAFKSPVYHSCLISDTVADVFSFKPNYYEHKHYAPKDYFVNVRQTKNIKDSMVSISFDLEDALLYSRSLNEKDQLTLPFPYEFEWSYTITSDLDFEMLPNADSTDMDSNILGDHYFKKEITQVEGSKALVTFKYQMKDCFVEPNEIKDYLELKKLLINSNTIRVKLNGS